MPAPQHADPKPPAIHTGRSVAEPCWRSAAGPHTRTLRWHTSAWHAAPCAHVSVCAPSQLLPPTHRNPLRSHIDAQSPANDTGLMSSSQRPSSRGAAAPRCAPTGAWQAHACCPPPCWWAPGGLVAPRMRATQQGSAATKNKHVVPAPPQGGSASGCGTKQLLQQQQGPAHPPWRHTSPHNRYWHCPRQLAQQPRGANSRQLGAPRGSPQQRPKGTAQAAPSCRTWHMPRGGQ
jgi:hypothetical protein